MWRFRLSHMSTDILVISVVKNREIIIIRSSRECSCGKSQYFRDTQVRANGMRIDVRMYGRGFPCLAARV
jgi:hypothetical protein